MCWNDKGSHKRHRLEVNRTLEGMKGARVGTEVVSLKELALFVEEPRWDSFELTRLDVILVLCIALLPLCDYGQLDYFNNDEHD